MVTTEKKDVMGDFDDLLESQGAEPSPQRVDKNLTRELLKERKSNILNQGITLIPTYPQSTKQLPLIPEMRQQQSLNRDYTKQYIRPQEETEVTNKNYGVSKYDMEESMPNDLLDEDDFDKLIGHIEKNQPMKQIQPKQSVNVPSTNRSKITSTQRKQENEIMQSQY